MDNPYQAPQSNVDHGRIEPKNKKGWKIFFWFTLGLQIVSVLFMWDDTVPEIHDLISNFVVYPLILLGLFGYAYDRRFLVVGFWKIMIFVGIAMDAYSIWSVRLLLNDVDFGLGIELYIMLGVFALIIPLMIFQYIGLYKYGFSAPEIWTKQSIKEEAKLG